MKQFHVANVVQEYLFLQHNDQSSSVHFDSQNARGKCQLADRRLSLKEVRIGKMH